ncbi:MAG: PilN domain-containing protein [Candidatus Sericytochromatia bacterium]|nr:PilN domain-containing protein [Candidatus Sericytochromatia bacterium]
MTTININLLPEELRPSKASAGATVGGISFSVDPSALMPIGIGAMVALVLFFTPSLLRSMWLDPLAEQLAEQEQGAQNEIDKYNTSLKDLQSQSEKLDLLKRQLTTLQGVAGVTKSWGEVLNELRTLTPGNMWFEEFKVDSSKSELLVKGGALDYGAVAYFQRNLEHSEYFAQPQLKKTENEADETTVKHVKFELLTIIRPLTGGR